MAKTNKSETKLISFKNAFPNAKVIAGHLLGSAGHHYGYGVAYQEVDDFLKDFKLIQKGKKPRFGKHKSAKEIAGLAKIPFTEFGSTFNSIDEVRTVSELLEERFGSQTLGPKPAKQIIADLLQEVRKKRK